MTPGQTWCSARFMSWVLLGLVAVGLVVAWFSYRKSQEGGLPPKETAPPAPLGAGFAASTESKLARAARLGPVTRHGGPTAR